jgi:hypothetical protein
MPFHAHPTCSLRGPAPLSRETPRLRPAGATGQIVYFHLPPPALDLLAPRSIGVGVLWGFGEGPGEAPSVGVRHGLRFICFPKTNHPHGCAFFSKSVSETPLLSNRYESIQEPAESQEGDIVAETIDVPDVC